MSAANRSPLKVIRLIGSPFLPDSEMPGQSARFRRLAANNVRPWKQDSKTVPPGGPSSAVVTKRQSSRHAPETSRRGADGAGFAMARIEEFCFKSGLLKLVARRLTRQGLRCEAQPAGKARDYAKRTKPGCPDGLEPSRSGLRHHAATCWRVPRIRSVYRQVHARLPRVRMVGSEQCRTRGGCRACRDAGRG